MRKARNGYQLQRGVPKDVQPVIGKTIWVEGAGSTYRVAQRLSPVFAAKTDRLIAEARNEVSLTGDELIDAVPAAAASARSVWSVGNFQQKFLRVFDEGDGQEREAQQPHCSDFRGLQDREHQRAGSRATQAVAGDQSASGQT